MGKEKRLEDIIPKETLDYILTTYKKIKSIEDFDPKEIKRLLKILKGIEEGLQKLTVEGWLSESVAWNMYEIIEEAALYRNKKGIKADLLLFFKSDLETTISRYKLNQTTSEKTVKRKTKGQPRQYAKAFLIASLAGEVKAITGKTNYKLLSEFLEPYYSIDEERLRIEVNKIKQSHALLHLVDLSIEHKLLL